MTHTEPLSLCEAEPKEKETNRGESSAVSKEPSTTGVKVEHPSSEVTGSGLTQDSDLKI